MNYEQPVAPFTDALEALRRLGECQTLMARTMLQGWFNAQAELTSLFWRLPALTVPAEKEAAVRQSDSALQSNAEEVGATLSRELAAAMAEAEALLGRSLASAPTAVASQPSAPMVKLPGTVLGYCVRCKMQREMRNPMSTVMKNGKDAMKGTCAACSAGMFKIGKP